MSDKIQTEPQGEQVPAVGLQRLVGLLAEWDSDVQTWERAAGKYASVGEHDLATRCSIRAYEIERCRSELKDAMQPNGKVRGGV